MLLLSFAWATPPDAEATRDAMGAHWALASAARDAVIAGDLGAARTAGGAFATSPPESDPVAADARKRLAPRFSALQRAPDLESAAKAVGEIAQACGACHTEHAAGRSFEPPEPPGPTPMEHHRAGAEWMWAGVVGGSGQLFDRGVKVLAAGNLVPTGLPEGTESRRVALGLEVQVQDLAASAGRATDVKRRAALYGRMLATCAACHQATVGGPNPVAAAAPDLVVSDMHAHFALLTAARMAVQAGDLEQARARGKDLVDLEPPAGLSGPWRPFVAEMKSDAAGLSSAVDLRDAGLAVSTLAVSCASCHVATQGGPTPPTRDALEGRGRDGALEVLWIALLSESDEAWALGAELMGGENPAYSLLDARSAEERAKVYGALLAP